MSTYYNDNDPKVAAWLSQLVATGQLPQGIIHASPIQEIPPSEVAKHTQCHFFAGIGGWSLALRLAGWPDDVPVWTGSCPCQPFSAAGKQRGLADERHLWPEFLRLIAECRPPVVFGEQVASRLGREWLAGVRADLESVGYAVGAADLCAAGVGAPHIRQRLYWVAYANGDGSLDGINSQKGFRPATASERGGTRRLADGIRPGWGRVQPHTVVSGGFEAVSARQAELGRRRRACRLADTTSGGLRIDGGASREAGHNDQRGEDRGMGDAIDPRLEGHLRHEHDRDQPGRIDQNAGRSASEAGGDSWSDYVLIPCADGKSRRIEPGIAPLAHGVPARVVRLRGYGNAIVPQVAATFVKAFLAAAREVAL